MKLYYAPGACSLATHIALREAEMPFTLERVDLKTKKTETGADFRAVSDKGYVPALALADGAVLSEATVILQYIADHATAAGLAPAAGTLERYRMMEWLNYIATELHKSLGPLFSPVAPEAFKEFVKQSLPRRFDYVESHLGTGYLLGEKFTVADAYLFTVLGWTKPLGIDLGAWPKIQAYMARIKERPQVRQAMVAEGLIKDKAA